MWLRCQNYLKDTSYLFCQQGVAFFLFYVLLNEKVRQLILSAWEWKNSFTETPFDDHEAIEIEEEKVCCKHVVRLSSFHRWIWNLVVPCRLIHSLFHGTVSFFSTQEKDKKKGKKKRAGKENSAQDGKQKRLENKPNEAAISSIQTVNEAASNSKSKNKGNFSGTKPDVQGKTRKYEGIVCVTVERSPRKVVPYRAKQEDHFDVKSDGAKAKGRMYAWVRKWSKDRKWSRTANYPQIGLQMIPHRKLSLMATANDPNWLLFVTFFTLRCYEWQLRKRN